MNSQPEALYSYISTDSAMRGLLDVVGQSPMIALDTEADSMYHYYSKVCLIQLSVDGENFIIDPLAGIDLAPLLEALTVKPLIFHGADYDLRMLRNSFNFRPGNKVFDTMIAATLIGCEKFGLTALVEEFFGVALSKSGQKSDWSRRPLTQAQLRYACDDTRYLHRLVEKLSAKLNELGRSSWLEQSCECLVEATAADNNNGARQAWRVRGSSRLDRRQLNFVYHLWQWREKQAQATDLPPFKILMNSTLIEIAMWAASGPGEPLTNKYKLPRTCTGGRLRALNKAIQKAEQVAKSDWPEKRKARLPDPSQIKYKPTIKALREETNHIAESLNISAGTLVSKAALTSIAKREPETVEEMMEAGPLMRWQAEILEGTIRKVLGEFK